MAEASERVIIENIRKPNLRVNTKYQDVHDFIKEDQNVYIGRPNRYSNVEGSVFYNPYPIREVPYLTNKEVKTAVLLMFINYFLQDETMIRRLHLLKGKTMGKCF